MRSRKPRHRPTHWPTLWQTLWPRIIWSSRPRASSSFVRRDSAAKTTGQSKRIAPQKMSMIWLKMPIPRLWDHNLLAVNAETDTLTRADLADLRESSAEALRRREGDLIIIARSDCARQSDRSP